jgi:poly(3-hydroxybutyrate) depolymerase
MAASMLAIYPEVFAGGAIIAGLAHGIAGTIPEAFDRMRGHGLPSEHDAQRKLRVASDHDGPWPKVSIWHGSSDQTVQSSNADTLAAQWRAVHSLDRAATYSKKAGVVSKEVWCDPSGEALIEINRIAGMGHGTPLARDLGNPGPFMLDVGVSSTREIAGFWGIADVDRNGTFSRPTYQTFKSRPTPSKTAERALDPPLAEPWTPDRTLPKISGVQKTIEDALRAAGLMR